MGPLEEDWVYVRSRGWGPHGGIGVMRRDTRELAGSLSLCRVRHSEKVAASKPGNEPSSEPTTLPPDLGLPASGTVESKCLLLKPPCCGLCYVA